jgi:serine phosphatase RsbU (regulator of sigma subunit)
MKLCLRAKLISAIAVAGILPLVAEILFVSTSGYQRRVHDEGVRCQADAAHVANELDFLADRGVANLSDLLVIGGISTLLQQAGTTLPPPAATPQDIHRLDRRWPSLPADSPEILATTRNPLARELLTFQRVNPIFSEILIADNKGRLIAATEKTSDYDQSDESWWQNAMKIPAGQAVLDTINYDESAKVFSLHISMPVLPPNGGEPLGVIKGVLAISSLRTMLPVLAPNSQIIADIVQADGRILLQLRGSELYPADRMFPFDALHYFKPGGSGWFIVPIEGESTLVGFSPAHLIGLHSGPGNVSGPSVYIALRQPARIVLRPILEHAVVVLVLGLAAVLICSLAGVWLLGRNVLAPIEALREAAAAVAATVEQKPPAAPGLLHLPPESPREAVARAGNIRTGDEIEDLAHDFSTMATRLLGYQEDLQREISEKTAEIQRDLDMARDFQHAFLPHGYPEMSGDREAGSLTLHFHHVYEAALTVSGDFFDIIKLDEHRAGILIADVMGHGTRSALVTAILRTLLHGLARQAEDPGEFLRHLNRHFHETMQQSGQVIFVSACYVILDTHQRTVECASAGHPSPLIGNRETRVVEPLFGALRDNPALGLFPENIYTVFRRQLQEQNILLLFTDGVVEATNATGSDFGRTRLRETFADCLSLDLAGITQSILNEVTSFTGRRTPDDDICLVAVEAVPHTEIVVPEISHDSASVSQTLGTMEQTA